MKKYRMLCWINQWNIVGIHERHESFFSLDLPVSIEPTHTVCQVCHHLCLAVHHQMESLDSTLLLGHNYRGNK